MYRIQAGPIKNCIWSVSVPDSRYILGEYESNLANLIEREVNSGRTLVDIGANAGYFSILAALKGDPSNTHIAVEPFPDNLQILKTHLEANNISNVKVVEQVISDKSGTVLFSNSGNMAANTYKSESSIFGDNSLELSSITLDDLAEKYSLDSSHLLKIDVEGAELDVLRGGAQFIEKHKPIIVLATHDCHVKGVKQSCLDFLNARGYDCQVLEDEKIDGQEDFFCRSDKSI